jgi:hypothetical protein
MTRLARLTALLVAGAALPCASVTIAAHAPPAAAAILDAVQHAR